MLEKLQKISPLATVSLAVVLAFTSFVGNSAKDTQSTQQNSAQVAQLQQQVSALQIQVAQQGVIQNELKNQKEQLTDLKAGVTKLSDKVDNILREVKKR